MNLKEKLLNIKELLMNKGEFQDNNINIPDDDKIKLLAALYTYNHGDKDCMPFEYSCKTGGKENGSGNYLLFEQEVQNLGYNVKEIVFIPNSYMLLTDAEAFENRKKTKQFYPKEVKYFVIVDKEEKSFILRETSKNLEFLARSGDRKAIKTYNNWMMRIGACNHIIVDEGNGISEEETIQKLNRKSLTKTLNNK